MARVLLLAGTGPARRLAVDLVEAGHQVTASLAGATTMPDAYPCPTRTGGFGGAEGLADYLAAQEMAALIDATHPFATRISANARDAARRTGIPLLRLARPPWVPEPDETWIEVPDMEAAARVIPTDARAFLATGRSSLEAFTARPDIWIALRQIDPPDAPFPGHGEYIIARPPFDIEAEAALFASLGITHLVVKNAGGGPARTKLTAAARLGIPVIMVQRPDEGAFDDLEPNAILARLTRP
ncbi:MAG: cobalt-precorrin-6A reductase [Pseudomonadota bacterium]